MTPPARYKPPAFVQVDVDGLWAVRACYDRPVGDTFERDPVWEQGVPAFQRLFAQLGLAASFFVVGRDLEVAAKREAARALADAGHEIANHSWSHTIGITRLPARKLFEEVARTHAAICSAGLPTPVGFRAPGYDVDERVHAALRRLGYRYDASMLPTRVAPLLRLADAWLARRWRPGRRQFGCLAHARAPRVPYFPQREAIHRRDPAPRTSGLLELPVATIGPWRLPLTASLIFALGADRVIERLRHDLYRRRPILFLLHGIDLVDCRQPIVFGGRRSHIAGFDRSADEKQRALESVLRFLLEHHDVVRADQWVARYIPPPEGSR